MKTTVFIFNENGLIPFESMQAFAEDVQNHSKFKLNVLDKSDIDPASTIFKKLVAEGLEFIIYDHGYVLKLEGEIINIILFLKELDKGIPDEIEFFLSPVQAIQNTEENKFPKGANLEQIGVFLDKLFNNKNYSNALNS